MRSSHWMPLAGREFLMAVRGEAPNPLPPIDAAGAVALVEATYRSASERKVIAINIPQAKTA